MGGSEQRIILCETRGTCTCGAPASTPRGMHHADCDLRNPPEGPATAQPTTTEAS